MQDHSRVRSLSLDDINVGMSSSSLSAATSTAASCRKGKSSSVDDDRQDNDVTEEGEGRDRDTLGELESPAIENLQDRLLVTPIRWQMRSEAAVAPTGLYRRDSAPATLLQKEDSISRRCSNPALLETIEEGQVSCRRKSTPAVMTQGLAQQRGRGGGAHLSPRRALLKAVSAPGSAPARRRSMPEISTHQRSPVMLETFYPPPRRNSLMSCSLAEVAARFELLNTNSRVPEESELLEKSRAGYDRSNGSGVSSSHSLPPITS
ncbi:uncharacterized protein LOC110973647 [Acanthaster planci]|uniref:Uncharacterized protein LOC110973647 n=1 Tax=Acanthaster planci TaxID=133434 RepID=A0A8B7XJK0_ACAPL|nr:uncharacterized protein LOC110973647 [Acanthaster planci]